MTTGSALAGRNPSSGDEALAHARAIAADWRDAGLQVGLVEHAARAGEPDGCVLIARSPTRVLHCACRPAASRDGRPLWSVEVSVGRCEDDPDGIEHVRLRTVGTAVADGCGPAWRQVLDWVHGGGTPEARPEEVPAFSGGRRGWAAGVARCRARLRAAGAAVAEACEPTWRRVLDRLRGEVMPAFPGRWRGRVGRHLAWGCSWLRGAAGRLPAPNLAGLATRLAQARRSFRAGRTRAGSRLVPSIARGISRDGSPVHALGRAVPLPNWRDVTGPLLKGGLICLAGVVIAVVGVCVAGWRFAKQDEQAYRAYTQMCAAAVEDGEAAEDEFWCKRARQLRLLYRFADAGGAAGQ